MKTEWTPQMMQVLRITAAYARAGRSRRAARLGADQASDYRSSGATIRAAALIELPVEIPPGRGLGAHHATVQNVPPPRPLLL